MAQNPPTRRTLYLLDAASRLELGVLRDWVRTHAADRPHEVIEIPSSRRRRVRRLDPRLAATLAEADDPELAPLRVAWLPAKLGGERQASFKDLFMLSDPRDPRRWHAAWILRRHPERCVVVVAETASEADLRRRWVATGEGDFAAYVNRQAQLSLERAERAMRGARYKVPRFVHEEILARVDFNKALAKLAEETKKPLANVTRTASKYLLEIAATHSPFVMDLLQRAIGYLYRQGYGRVHYSPERLKAIYANAQRHPIVFLPTHKSNLDHLLMQYVLYENNYPPSHAAGGINMNFFPIGPLIRRSGVFFIRRTFKDNPLYKLVLRQYVDYLIEKRFTLEWYFEGGRSRTGKLLPPRMGMLAYVADALRRGKCEDVIIVPVSIAYDQISDVGSYVAEQKGAKKEAETFGWAMRTMRNLRRRYGNIHIRFGETLSLAKALGPATELAVQKVAFEVAVRVNRVTPLTAPSLVALAILGEEDRAMSLAELVESLGELSWYVGKRGLPTTKDLGLASTPGIEEALAALIDTGVLVRYDEGREPLFGIAPGQHLAASYYRNTIVHFFVPGGIAELALLAAADARGDALAAFWDDAMKLRDLFKFEFFFSEKDAFRTELAAEVSLHAPDWEARLARSASEAHAVLRTFRPFMSHRALRAFVEAYGVVADALVRHADEPYKEADFLASALALGRQYLLQKRIRCPEAVSKTIFASAASLAGHRGLLEGDAPTLLERRKVFALELDHVLRRIDAVDALQAGRRTGIL